MILLRGTAMPKLSLNHFSIRSLDLDKTVQFFSDVLNLKPGPRPNFPFPGAWLYNEDSSDYANSVVHIIAIDKNDPAGLKQYLGDRDASSLQGSGAVDHIAFFTTGLEKMTAHLKNLDVPFRERTVPSLNLHQVFVDDPNGIVIELNYPTNEKTA